jgi:hypothetical protein
MALRVDAGDDDLRVGDASVAGPFDKLATQPPTLPWVSPDGELVRPSSEGRYRWQPAMGDIPTRNTEQPCPHCQARCPECNDEGKLRCQAFGCGGRGIIVHAQRVCTAQFPDPHPQSCACKGTKRIVTQSEPCPVCQCTQYQICALCGGTKLISTGRDNAGREEARAKGHVALWEWTAKAPRCVPCRGTGRVQETLNEQDIKNLEYAKKVVAELSRVRV